jgi:hypothetical protein
MHRHEGEHTFMNKIRLARFCRVLRVSAWVAAILFSLAINGHAQGASGWSPQIEFAGLYSYMRANPANAGGLNLNGASESLAYGFSSHFSAIADVGQYRFSGLGFGLKSSMYTYLFGPRVTFRKNGRITYFAQVLAGGGRLNASSGGISAGENALAVAAGGGLDIPFGAHLAIRAVQADYLLTRFDSVAGTSASQNHIRISAGIVVRFGGE